MGGLRIETERLGLRPLGDEDRPVAYAVAEDPEVMRYLPGPTHAEADALVDRQMAMQAAHGHCFWAVERRSDGRMIGFCGIAPPRPPLVEYEIGWRLAREAWKQGYAIEAAQATLRWAWANLATDTVVAITVPDNRASQRVMERIGMTRQPEEDFDHPSVAPDDPLCRHVLYRIHCPA